MLWCCSAENTVKNRWNSSTYKRWLAENGHQPGPDMSVYDLGKLTFRPIWLLVSVFGMCILTNGGYVGSTAGSVAAFQQLVQRLTEAEVHLDPEVEASLVKATNEEKVTLGPSKRYQGPSTAEKEPLRGGANGMITSGVGTVGLPQHLRPANILIKQPLSSQEESTAGQIAEILHLLKSTTHKEQATLQKKSGGGENTWQRQPRDEGNDLFALAEEEHLLPKKRGRPKADTQQAKNNKLLKWTRDKAVSDT